MCIRDSLLPDTNQAHDIYGTALNEIKVQEKQKTNLASLFNIFSPSSTLLFIKTLWPSTIDSYNTIPHLLNNDINNLLKEKKLAYSQMEGELQIRYSRTHVVGSIETLNRSVPKIELPSITPPPLSSNKSKLDMIVEEVTSHFNKFIHWMTSCLNKLQNLDETLEKLASIKPKASDSIKSTKELLASKNKNDELSTPPPHLDPKNGQVSVPSSPKKSSRRS